MTTIDYAKYEALLVALSLGKPIERKFKEGWEELPWGNALRAIAVLVPATQLRIKE